MRWRNLYLKKVEHTSKSFSVQSMCHFSTNRKGKLLYRFLTNMHDDNRFLYAGFLPRFKYKDDYEKFKLALSAIAMGLSVTNLIANLR